jgi:phenylalanyl-tRNA synthetase alpha chain
MPARGPVPVPSQAARDLPHEVLRLLDDKGDFSTNDAFPEVPHRDIKSALDRLASRSMVVYDTKDTEVLLLTKEAEDICDKGSHEYRVWDAVRQRGKVPIKQLAVSRLEPSTRFSR